MEFRKPATVPLLTQLVGGLTSPYANFLMGMQHRPHEPNYLAMQQNALSQHAILDGVRNSYPARGGCGFISGIFGASF